MPKPVCVPCQCFLRMKHSGFYFVEGMPTTSFPARGKDAEGWKPYKIWVGDLYECPECHTQIVSGFSNAPLTEHYQPEFKSVMTRTGAMQLFVKDC